VLWILACVATALLCYEIPTLVTAVLRPLWNNPNALQTDFHYYYEAAQRFSADAGRLYLPTDDVIAGFAYPPPAILPFVVLTRLPLGAAFLVMTVASYAALVIAARLWCSYLRRQGVTIAVSTEFAVTLIAVALAPSYMNVMIGQVNAFVLVSAIGFVSFAPLLPAVGATFLALGIWLKIYPIVLAGIGSWDPRNWRALGWTIAIGLAIAISLLPLVPPSAYQSFLTEVLPARIDKTAIHITNQSLGAFLERFHYPSLQFLNWTGEQAVTVSALVRIGNSLFAVGAVLLFWTRARDGDDVAKATSAASMIALIAMIAPLGWGHTYVMVVPLVIVKLIDMRDASPLRALAIAVCLAALFVPAGRRFAFIELGPDWFQNLVYSRYLLATIVLAVIPTMRVGQTTESITVASA
jgi:alpha-1,2-mannosyltransferase